MAPVKPEWIFEIIKPLASGFVPAVANPPVRLEQGGGAEKITATEIHNAQAFAGSGLQLDQAQILICTANSTGGVMGKMIDAQSIVVSTAATNQLGKEADIFKAVVWHSIFLACLVGLLTLLQAYLVPFTGMVPHAR